MDFLWKLQAIQEKNEMADLQAYNRKLLSNILPVHIAEYFLSSDHSNEVCSGLDMKIEGFFFTYEIGSSEKIPNRLWIILWHENIHSKNI